MEGAQSQPRQKLIETASTAELLRSKIIDVERKRILISRIAGSDQEGDLTVPPNCGGFGRIRHFKRQSANGWPQNPLPIDPACRALGLAATDLIRVQAFQNAGCPWRCWYCFVPFDLLAGNPNRAAWMSADELIDLYLIDSDRPAVIDLTGGSPDLSPEWVLWVMRALRARGLERSTYLWSDDNLSTDYMWRYFTREERQELVTYPMYGRVACFKGFDAASFSFNTHANPVAFDAQFEIMKRLVSEGIDCYAYATFTAPTVAGLDLAMREFVDRLQRIDGFLPLRTVPLHIEQFSPVTSRLNDSRRNALVVQDAAIYAWNDELSRRFTASERAVPIDRVPLGRR